MKVVILAGGRGTRLAEETKVIPKPMVTIGDQPILWHIMQTYSSFGLDEFVVALGYKGAVIRDYFLNFDCQQGDVAVNLGTGSVKVNKRTEAPWNVRLVDTGQNTMTGGRVGRLATILRNEGTFLLTYGDGLANVDIDALLAVHRSEGRLATVTAVRPPARFGRLQIDGDQVTDFAEKPQLEEGWINGGFFAFEPEIFDYIDGDDTILEAGPLENLAADGQLSAYRHYGFWHAMDTLRDRNVLEDLWATDKAPWRRQAVAS